MLALYCVFRSNGASVELPRAITGSPTFLVSEGDLGAAVSDLGDSGPGDIRESALAHHRVIEALHRQLTVIPVRYGAFVHDRSEIERLLADKQQQYLATLEEIQGCVEMTIRVRTGRSLPHASPSPVMPSSTERTSREDLGSGTAYLARRRAELQHEAAFDERLSATGERYRKPFEGLFRHVKVEPASGGIDRDAGCEFLALHFLIPDMQVEPFRTIFRRLHQHTSGQTMMSGPWPPYNFVTPADSLATS
ncbi:MAG: GvpL/GvpF family gas vesicle protein, partial [Deltaproteobacteria bacterium]